MKGSYLETVHFKPYLYLPSYANGVLIGYLIESDNQSKGSDVSAVREVVHNSYVIAKHVLFVMILLAIIQLILGFWPVWSAIEASLFPTVVSIILCWKIYSDDFGPLTRSILNNSVWKPLRSCIRVSYIIHPLVYTFTQTLFAAHQLSPLALIAHMIVSLVVNILIAIALEKLIEKPLFEWSKSLSKAIFA